MTYTLTVTNNGTASATGVTLTDTLPSGAAFVSATGGAKPTGGVLTFTLGDLAAGADSKVTIVVTPAAAGSLNDVAKVSMDQTEPNPANSTVTLATTVTSAGGTPGTTSTTSPSATPAAPTPSPDAQPDDHVGPPVRLPHPPHEVRPDLRPSSRRRAGRRSGQLSPGGHGRPRRIHPLPLGDV